MRKTLLTLVVGLLSLLTAKADNWEAPTPSDYSGSAVYYVEAQLNGTDVTLDDGVELAAFIDGTLRGYQTDVMAYGDNATRMLLRVYGNAADAGKIITFKAKHEGVTYTFKTTKVWSVDGGVTTPPLVLNMQVAGTEAGISALILDASYTLSSETTPKESVDLYSKLKFKVNGEEKTASDLDAVPDLVYENTNSSACISVSEQGVVTAVSSTTASGTPVKVSIVKSYATSDRQDEVVSTSTDIIVTPIAKELISVHFDAETYDIGIGATINMKEHLYLVYRTGKDASGNDITSEVQYSTLTDGESITWTCTCQVHFTFDSGTGVATGVTSTDILGDEVTATLASLSASAHIRVTPIAYVIQSLSWTTSKIEKSIEDTDKTIDLLDYLQATVVLNADKEEGTKPIKEVAYTGTFSFTTNDASETYLSISGNTATVKHRTLAAGVNVTATYAAGESNIAITNNPLTVVVTPVIVPLQSLTITPAEGSVLVNNSYDVTVTLTPADAYFEPENLVFSENAASETAGSSSHLSYAKSDDGLTCTITGEALGTWNTAVNYSSDYYTAGSASFTLTTHVGATFTAISGWDWVSYSLFSDNMSTPANLNTNVYGGTLYDLRSQTASTYNDPTYGFFGDLTTVTAGAYHAQTTAASTKAIYPTASAPLSQTINAGWTWLFYPYQCNLSLEDLKMNDAGLELLNNMFAGLTQTRGDKIISKAGGSLEYAFDGGWTGDLTFEAGKSYLMYCAAGGTMTWPNEAMIQRFATPSGSPAPSREESVWSYDASQFEGNMVIVGQVDCDEDLQIGAFVGDECRGEGHMVMYNGERYYFITVAGRVGESVNFKAYDGEEYMPLTAAMDFKQVAGSLDAPVALGECTPNSISTLTNDWAAGQTIIDLGGRQVKNCDAKGVYIISGNGVTRKVMK